jgi:hypothetical protein
MNVKENEELQTEFFDAILTQRDSSDMIQSQKVLSKLQIKEQDFYGQYIFPFLSELLQSTDIFPFFKVLSLAVIAIQLICGTFYDFLPDPWRPIFLYRFLLLQILHE